MTDQLLMLREQRTIEHLDMCVFAAERGIPASPIVIQTCSAFVEAMKQGFAARYSAPPASDITEKNIVSETDDEKVPIEE